MATFSAAPIITIAGADPNIDGTIIQQELPPERWAANLGDPHFAITVEWSMPAATDQYTHCRVVRSVRSPARRAEEGQTMAEYKASEWPTHSGEFGRPNYTDVQPPSREWVFYTLFFLDLNRVWTYGGAAGEMGSGDFDWTLRLPELLPGAAVNNEIGVAHPADQHNTLTTFLQGPGVFLDTAVSMGEAAQFFWDPIRCPPHAVPHISKSWGYRYDETLGLGRTRYMLDALKSPDQGSIWAVQRIVDGVIGSPASVRISNNLMLDVNDSSFESGDILDQSWGPLRPVNSEQNAATSLSLLPHSGDIGQTKLPPNVGFQYYMHIPAPGRKITCQYYTEYDDNGNVVPDPIQPTPPLLNGKAYPLRISDVQLRGIPLQGWSVVRMGLYAKASAACTVIGKLDIYDSDGVFRRTIDVLNTRTMTASWKWFGNGDDKYDTPPGSNSEPAGATAATQWSVPLPTDIECAFGIPSITVSNACDIDLIVVDDG